MVSLAVKTHTFLKLSREAAIPCFIDLMSNSLNGLTDCIKTFSCFPFNLTCLTKALLLSSFQGAQATDKCSPSHTVMGHIFEFGLVKCIAFIAILDLLPLAVPGIYF